MAACRLAWEPITWSPGRPRDASSTAASNNLLITGQQVTGTAGSNADYWNAQQFGPGSEVWVTVATKPNVDNDPVVLGLRAQNPGLSTLSAYQMY
jgi:hypothetical protein